MKLRILWGLYGYELGVNTAKNFLGATEGQIKYWKKKV